MVTYVYRDGARLTPYMKYQIDRLDAAFYRRFKLHLIVSSGIRTHQEQIDIFLRRYTTNPGGRRVYTRNGRPDIRYWQGRKYYRIDPVGTVAVPGTSNHEVQGTTAAVDLRDTGKDPGVLTMGTERARWLKAEVESGKYDMDPEGYNFAEAWHFRVRNINKAVPGTAGGGSRPVVTKKEVKVVKHYHTEDATARKSGRIVKPGGGFWLHRLVGQPTSKASNVVGGVGPYTLSVHVYAEGRPGDFVDVVLYWDATKTSGPHSPHYTQRVTIGKDGKARETATFLRGVASGDAVYARLGAAAGNTAPVKVTIFDVDSYLFSS